MCVGIKVEDPPLRGDTFEGENFGDSSYNPTKQKRRNNDERKEKAKDAARTRRTQESDYFEDLERLLPVTGPPPSSQQTTLDKTSIIRLSVAHLKTHDVLKNGLQMPQVKEEIYPDMDLFSCLDGFSLILGVGGDVIYVSDNVSKYIGLTQVELLGQEFCDYVHPCDHEQLKQLTPAKNVPSEGELVEIFVRVKCTVTERGRMINLRQANYKSLKISGKARCMPENEVGGVTGTVFIGIARYVFEREVIADQQIGVFTTKHSADMKFMETNYWISSVASYSPHQILGTSFYELVHAEDIRHVQKAFLNLKDHGQCETPPYRLLCSGGGFVWVQSKACMASSRRGSSKAQTISCSHQQISEVMNRGEIISLVQMNGKPANSNPSSKDMKIKKDTVSQNSLNENLELESSGLIQFEIIEDTICHNANNASKVSCKPQSVIIEPRQTHDIDQTRFRVDIDKKTPSMPTSVIVKCRQPEPQVVTESIFCKPVEVGKSKMPNSVTESLWVKQNVIPPVSEPAPRNPAFTPSASFVPFINPNSEEITEYKDTDILNELFINLNGSEIQNLPSGNQCIPLRKTEAKSEQTAIESAAFDDMICLDFDEREEQKPKSVTESLWCKNNTLTSATESIFSIKEVNPSPTTSDSEIHGISLPFVNIHGEGKVKERDFFDDLFSKLGDLENLAPHSGGQYIPLNKEKSTKDPPIMETVNFDDMICLEFDDDSDFPRVFGDLLDTKQNEVRTKEIEKIIKPIEKQKFDHDQVLIDPDRNTMWGFGNHSPPQKIEHDDLMEPIQRSGQKIWRGGLEKRDKCDSSTSHKSGMIHGGYGIRQSVQNLDICRIQDDYCFEPPEEKIVNPPKYEKYKMLKRKFISSDEQIRMLSKKSKFCVENDQNVSSTTNNAGYVTMGHNFHTNISDIEVVTIN